MIIPRIPQDPPFSVQVELVEGCTLSCEFCGINGIREKPGNFKFMSMDTLTQVAGRLQQAQDEFGWNPRYEFAMHGEPSMHPTLIAAMTIFRRMVGKKASIVLFSNGSGFVKRPGLLDELLGAGVNTIGLDAYEHVDIVPRLLKLYADHWYLNPSLAAPIFHYPEQKEHNLHSGRRVGHRDIVVIKDISKADDGNHSTLNTHCGGGMEPQGVLAARCAKPFRELAIRWDGNVALCCNDFRGIYKCGNVLDTPLNVLWNNDFFHAARKRLMVRDRNFLPCSGCNAKSMRVGLLPDKKGIVTMDLPTEADIAVTELAASGEPYTAPVRRSWEIDDDKAHFPVGGSVYPLNLMDRKKLEKAND